MQYEPVSTHYGTHCTNYRCCPFVLELWFYIKQEGDYHSGREWDLCKLENPTIQSEHQLEFPDCESALAVGDRPCVEGRVIKLKEADVGWRSDPGIWQRRTRHTASPPQQPT